jgi:hypothetical protein
MKKLQVNMGQKQVNMGLKLAAKWEMALSLNLQGLKVAPNTPPLQ